jgi:hypothetical protein
MPSKFKCTNFGACERADSKAIIEANADGAIPTCPSCSRDLTRVPDGGGKGPNKLVIGLVAGLAVVGLAAYLLMPTAPDPQKADQMLTDFFPSLPK